MENKKKNEELCYNMDKIKRYKWELKDSAGKMEYLDKTLLKIDESYQRTARSSKVLQLASNWSWVGCGVITIGYREGFYWVIDGQHRVMAAMKRSDIQFLPCLVFDTENIQQEATGFLDANIGRKPVNTVDKFRASIVAGNETALYVNNVFLKYGFNPTSSACKPMDLKSIGWAMKKAESDKPLFDIVMKTTSELCVGNSIAFEDIMEGLAYIHLNCNVNLSDTKLRQRIKQVGVDRLRIGAKRAAAFYVRGGSKVWADGMMQEINKGIRCKFILGSNNI